MEHRTYTIYSNHHHFLLGLKYCTQQLFPVEDTMTIISSYLSLQVFLHAHFIQFQLLAFLYWFDDGGSAVPQYSDNAEGQEASSYSLHRTISGCDVEISSLNGEVSVSLCPQGGWKLSCKLSLNVDGFGENELNFYVMILYGRANPRHVMECYMSISSSPEAVLTTVHLNTLAQLISSSHWYSAASFPHKLILMTPYACPLPNAIKFQGEDMSHTVQGHKFTDLNNYGMNAEWILASERQLTSICTLLSHGRNCITWVSLCNKWLLLVIYNTRVAPSDHKNIPYTIEVYRQLSYHHRQFKK